MDAPSTESALKGLKRYHGEAAAWAIWKTVCEKVGCSPDTQALDDLERAFQQLGRMDGTSGVVGKSLLVRLRTYQSLSQLYVDRF